MKVHCIKNTICILYYNENVIRSFNLTNPVSLITHLLLMSWKVEEGPGWEAGVLLRELAVPLPLPGTSSFSQTLNGQRIRPLSHIYEDNLAQKRDKTKVALTLQGISV